jgi:hypothetical protein
MATPTKFYKYTTVDTAKKILDKNSLQWSSPSRSMTRSICNSTSIWITTRRASWTAYYSASWTLYMGRAQPSPGSVLDENARILRVCAPGLGARSTEAP